ncbi:MAG TPA: alpha/beta family hydrolase [Vicinamibacterales bacterium]|nr:alpha/beta family hydrolase [Vicinamibacterales bacterium]
MTGEFTLETEHGPITTRRYSAHERRAAVLLAHGAGAGQMHPFMMAAATAFTAAGFEAITFDFPYMEAGRRVPDPAPTLEKTFADVARECCSRWLNGGVPYFAGGKSMGGRIASQTSAHGLFAREPDGLVFLGYPLHPPGNAARRRDEHLAKVKPPMLFVHGTRDPFGSAEEMQEVVKGLRRATLSLIEGGGHSFEAAQRDGGDRSVQAFDAAIAWMRDRIK